MRRRLAGEHVYRSFRLVGEQDVVEGVRPEDRLGTQLAIVEVIVGLFFGHRITSLRGLSHFSPRKTASAEGARKRFTLPVFGIPESVNTENVLVSPGE